MYLSLILGDSIQNILGDIFSCALGYIVGTVFLAVELWWLSLVWIVISEVIISCINSTNRTAKEVNICDILEAIKQGRTMALITNL